MITNTIAATSPSRIDTNPKGSTDWVMWVVCGTFTALLTIWFICDHSWPYWDAAAHVKDSFGYTELFRHPKFWTAHWIHDFLTVNFAYPLTVHAFTGFLKAVLGSSKWVEDLSLIIFSIILNFSTYSLVRTLFTSRLTAALSVLLINCYPLASSLSHFPMLDFPHLSLYALAMFTIAHWQQSPSMRHAVFMGIGVALAITSKQISVLYFVFPALLILFNSIRQSGFSLFPQLSAAAAIASAWFFLWVIPNAANLQKITSSISTKAEKTSIVQTFIVNFPGYLQALPEILSPVLCGAFLLSALLFKRNQWSKLSLLAVSAITGMLMVSGIRCSNPEARYIVPVLLTAAVITASVLSEFLRSRLTALKLLAAAVLVVALTQYIILNFTPYPMAISPWLAQFNDQLTGPKTSAKTFLETLSKPTPAGDVWGQEWIIDTIATTEHKTPCWLLVMPSTPQLSVHTLDVISLYKSARVRPTTLRDWTLLGDTITFSEKSVGYFHWFLLKTGDQGNRLRDRHSYDEYQKIEDYVKHSGKFTLKAERVIADSSKLSLYRLNF